ncbi:MULTISPECIES: HAMP domain-containing sensor histidine kinase [unclassified Streptomyces]|uniref:sensor histidine kinase n=1 Tax=unclassified Streptomyces TaxID=2593676 RepID=UPI00088344DA|nr:MULTISPECIES: HAMP domain-containing sensor histidine kinase [unclassified Streptomyces]PBC86067.1 signal transduction histidine kinase [Streptomyces sp. 2321.6]SDQ97175.1 Signal transduction histidine kinase [Streptomyces sp. KS_16]SED82567.1 Signal transduction histidine kinase [Streptomyces sp. 2112.3]SED87492.1 Signal transduction histidine kinase [Streptomyces sp. 2133.1]SNC72947.1 Signal transduction histidine kinase [Streptomyces sp. 2114.4]
MSAVPGLLAASARRCRPRTLRGRLSLIALTTAALVMVVLTVVFNTIVRQRLQQQADDELRTRAGAVAATVDTRHHPVRVLETPGDAALDTNVWIYAGTRLLEHPSSAPPGDTVTATAARLAAHGGKRCAAMTAGDRIRLCAEPVGAARPGTGPAAAVVVTAMDLAPYHASADTLLIASLALDAGVLACTYAVTRLAVGRALRPVRAMTEQATRWSVVASAQRFGAGDRPVELTRLGASLDELLDRIRAVLRHEQQLTGELSHELRNPLARITAELDWWQARPRSAAETRATHTAIADAATSMRTICDTVLDDARAGAHTVPGTADAMAVLRRLAARLDAPGRITLTVSGPDTLVAGVPAALLERIVAPLLDNALRYARTRVALRVAPEPEGMRVAVVDDGPGVPAAFTAHLFQPGRRADPEDGHGGAGLGLPLARRLARSADGEVTHDAGHTPGTRFVVSLPAG